MSNAAPLSRVPTLDGSSAESQEHATGPESPDLPSTKPEQAFIVEWDDGDPANPFNWSVKQKCFVTFQLAMLAMIASMDSSIMAPAERAIAAELGASQEATVLVVSLYVLGFALGPLLWAPISELYGRRVSLLPAMFLLAIFNIGAGFSHTSYALFVCRFFAGVCGSAPVSNVSAALGDIWAPTVRGIAVSLYAVAVTGGPTIGPVIGAALTVNPHLGWRWTQYIMAIWAFAFFIVSAILLPEAYAPVLLKKRAQQKRKETGNDQWHSKFDRARPTVKELVTKHFTRPFIMLTTEPMVTCLAIYASFVYGLLYMTLEVFPIVFLDMYRWPTVSSTLPFLALLVGVLCALGINLSNQPRYHRIVDKNGGKAVPEARLPPMVLGAIFFVIGLFWFGWTAAPRISWISPVFAAGFIGAGFNIIFQQAINFLVDAYGQYAASAVSANTILRSLFACALPLAAGPMFNNLGVGPAMSILGGVAALALPVPFLFMKFGPKLRTYSKFAPNAISR